MSRREKRLIPIHAPRFLFCKLGLRAQTTLRGTSIQQAGPAPRDPMQEAGARSEKHSGLWLGNLGVLEVKMGRGEEEKQTKQQLSPLPLPALEASLRASPGVGVG